MTGQKYYNSKVCEAPLVLPLLGKHSVSTDTAIAGVAIMALGSLAANPDSGLKIIPCGMNYFHAHKFRSRAVVEFGSPIEVPDELVKMYASGERREAVRQLLDTIYQALVAVTVTSPDYDTLMVSNITSRRPCFLQSLTPLTVDSSRSTAL